MVVFSLINLNGVKSDCYLKFWGNMLFILENRFLVQIYSKNWVYFFDFCIFWKHLHHKFMGHWNFRWISNQTCVPFWCTVYTKKLFKKG